MDALDKYIRERPAACIYHYTGAAGMIGIVQSGHLWATDYRHLNDRKEYQIGARLLRDELRANRLSEQQRRGFETLVSDTQRECFVLSFSESADQLSQWRAYCPGGNGYALGFEQKNALFASAQQHTFNLIRCEYNHREQRKLCRYLVESFMEGMASRRESLGRESTPGSRVREFVKRYQWNLALALVMSGLKHSEFDEEKACRPQTFSTLPALRGIRVYP
jgi:hypothetical protein